MNEIVRLYSLKSESSPANRRRLPTANTVFDDHLSDKGRNGHLYDFFYHVLIEEMRLEAVRGRLRRKLSMNDSEK